MRLDKFLSNMGLGSRTDVKKLMDRGMVTVNGTTVLQGKAHVNPDRDLIKVGANVIAYQPFVYLMLNKPQDYVSATKDKVLPTVLALVPPEFQHYDLFPAGRLDRNTVGLLLLTNDGQLAHQLLSPKYHVGKTYRVTAKFPLSEDDLTALRNGVEIPYDYTTMPAEAVRVDNAENLIDLTIREGKYHQVKEMLIAVNNQVTFLERIRFGPLDLDPRLSRGDMRPLSPAEIEALKTSAKDIVVTDEDLLAEDLSE